MKKVVYLDHAATTPVAKEVQKAMQPYFNAHFANPSALYKEALVTNGALTAARRSVAEQLHTTPDTIIFTSGATESNNIALQGIAKKHVKHGQHIITVATEHHAVLYPLEALEQWGYEVTVLSVNKEGLVRAEDVIKAIRPETILISVMFANNEIGTIAPIAEIGRQLLRYRKDNKTNYPYFHTDATQAAGYLDIDVEKTHVDLMTINSGKIYGPKGSGALYVRRGVPLEPVMYGGSQERSVRAGTENVPGIVGFAQALTLAQKMKAKESTRLTKLAEQFYKKLQKLGAILNGPVIGPTRLANNINVHFPGIDGEALVIYLDSLGVMCATGSACTAVAREPSHVLTAIGKNEAEVLSSVRFTLGRSTTTKDLDFTLQAIKKALPMIKSTR